MGGTGNSDTYPYGLRSTIDHDEVYNRVTGELVEQFPRFTSGSASRINELVAEFKSATPEKRAAILGEKAAA